jgi:AcrR family transcriptional regulator
MSPRSSEKFEEMREEKKTLIMDAALEHFSNVGFHATTITHIARHAGISKGLMYNYFKSKDDLLAAIINRSLTEIYGTFNPDHDSQLTTEEFELFIRKVFALFREKRQSWKLLFRIMMQQGVYENLLSEEKMPISVSGTPLREFSENMIMLLGDYFAREKGSASPDYDPGIEMLMFINTIKGFAMTYLFAAEHYQGEYYEKMIDALIRRFK